FDVIIVASQKPAFFQERRPLMQRWGEDVRPATFPLERGVLYEGGNLHDFEATLGVTRDRILYVGDHIYAYILRSKKESAWSKARTNQEKEAEVSAHKACSAEQEKSAALEERREELEDQLRYYQQSFKELTRKIDDAPQRLNGGSQHEADRGRVKRAVERI